MFQWIGLIYLSVVLSMCVYSAWPRMGMMPNAVISADLRNLMILIRKSKGGCSQPRDTASVEPRAPLIVEAWKHASRGPAFFCCLPRFKADLAE